MVRKSSHPEGRPHVDRPQVGARGRSDTMRVQTFTSLSEETSEYRGRQSSCEGVLYELKREKFKGGFYKKKHERELRVPKEESL